MIDVPTDPRLRELYFERLRWPCDRRFGGRCSRP